MTKDEIAAVVNKVFTDAFGDEAFGRLEQRPIIFRRHDDKERRINDLDSLDHLEFVMALEDEFDVEIGEAGAAKITTLDDAVAAVEKILLAPPSGSL
jgi:acyl carrier protein